MKKILLMLMMCLSLNYAEQLWMTNLPTDEAGIVYDAEAIYFDTTLTRGEILKATCNRILEYNEKVNPRTLHKANFIYLYRLDNSYFATIKLLNNTCAIIKLVR